MTVRVRWNAEGWYLSDEDNSPLFSFDLPPQLFEMYAENGVLTGTRALDLKESEMAQWFALKADANLLQIISFKLDREWLRTIRANLRTTDF